MTSVTPRSVPLSIKAMILCKVNTAGVEIHRVSQQVHFYFIAGIAITTETKIKNDSA